MLWQLCLSLILFCGSVLPVNVNASNQWQSIPEIFDSATQAVVYCNGVAQTYACGDPEYAQIMAALDLMSQGAHDMPAFGVSLDTETRQARQTGLWLELVFDGVQTFDGYPFESLLFEVRADDTGFNLNRQVNGKYEGRCLYLALAGDMRILVETLDRLGYVC